MLGAALGGILGSVLPGASDGTWALLGMAGALAGVTRCLLMLSPNAVARYLHLALLVVLFVAPITQSDIPRWTPELAPSDPARAPGERGVPRARRCSAGTSRTARHPLGRETTCRW
jgi:hypothetical protein